MSTANDTEVLVERNRLFIEAFRSGSWQLLSPILAPDFAYLDGATGEVWSMARYIADLDAKPLPSIEVDQVRVLVSGNVGVVSARSFTRAGRFNRYVDTYERRDDRWLCVHACVWPLIDE